RLPRLVPEDRVAQAVYLRVEQTDGSGTEIRVVGDGELEFLGRCSNTERSARLLLLSPTGDEPASPDREAPVQLDFARAVRLAPPAGRRVPDRPIARDDLEGLWASAQAARFATLEAWTRALGFYGFARCVTGRKYGVPAPALPLWPAGPETDAQRLYETLTGATAFAETLQLQ